MKKRYIAVVLFLLVGLPTFVFANPSDDAEQESLSKTVSNSVLERHSYSEAVKAVDEAVKNLTVDTVETARNEINNATDATEEQIHNLQQRVIDVEETIDVVALVKEVETLADKVETRELAKEKYNNAIIEVNKLDEGEVKENLEERLEKVLRLFNDTTLPKVTGIDENVPTNKNDIVYVSDEFLYSVIIDDVLYTEEDFTIEGDSVKFQKKITSEKTHTIVAIDKQGNRTTKTFTIDKTVPKKNAVNANVNGYDNKIKEQYAINGKTVTAYITVNEELKENPTFTFFINGKEVLVVKDEVVAGTTTNADYPYKYTAKLKITEDLVAEDGDITYTVTDLEDKAGNKMADITKLTTTGKVLKLDRTANRVTFTTIATDNKTVEGNVYYVTNGDTITFRMGVREKFSENPVVTIGGKEVKLEYVKYFAQPNHHEYRGTLKIDDNESLLKDGQLNIVITGSKDIAGNYGFYYQTNGKKVLNTITTKATTNGKSLIYDNTAPKLSYVAMLSKASDYKYAKNGDTIRFLVAYSEEVKLNDDFVVVFNNTTKKLVRSGDKTKFEYIAEFKIPADESNLIEGPLTFEVRGAIDKLGNLSEVVTTANHYKYNSVIYDRTAPEFTSGENGINPLIKAKDSNPLSFKIYRNGTEKAIHEFDGAAFGNTFTIGWHGGGVYSIVAIDAAGNESKKVVEVYHNVNVEDDLISALKLGGTAIVNQDITIDSLLDLAEGTELKINLQGNKLNLVHPEGETGKLIVNNGKLTISNGSVACDEVTAKTLIRNEEGAELVFDNIEYTDYAGTNASSIYNKGKLTILNSKINGVTKTNGNTLIANYGELTIKKTDIKANSVKGYFANIWNGKVLIDECNLDTERGGLAILGGDVTINNTNIDAAVGGTNYRALYIVDGTENVDVNVTINGGNFVGYRDCIYIGHSDAANMKVRINGGYFGLNKGPKNDRLFIVSSTKNPKKEFDVIVKGGTFNFSNLGNLNDYIAEGYRKNSEGRIVKENAISTKAELVNAINEGGKFELDTDLTLVDEPLTIKKDKEVEIDLNGKTIIGRSTNSSASKLITVNEGATLKLTGNGTINFTAGNPDTNWGGEGQLPFPGYSSNTISNIGKLVIDGPTLINNTARGGASYVIDNYQGSELIVKSGKIHQTGGDQALRIFANSNTLTTTLTIEGGEIIGRRALWIQLPQSDVTRAPKVNVNITGGTLRSYDTGADGYNLAIYSYSYGESFKNVNVNITGGEFFGHVAFGGGAKNGKETVNVTGGKFHNDLGRYLENDGWEDITKPE